VLTIVPTNSTEMILIREIGWWFDNNAAISGNPARRVRLQVTQNSPPPTGCINLPMLQNDIFGAMNVSTLHSAGSATVGAMLFDPPIKLDATSENVTIQQETISSGTVWTGGIATGNMRIVAIGWALLTADY
jgi:hypothetical protein